MDGTCSRYGGQERCIQNLLGRSNGRGPFGRITRRWEDNIKMDLQEVGWGNVCIPLAQDRDRRWAFVGAVMNLRFP